MKHTPGPWTVSDKKTTSTDEDYDESYAIDSIGEGNPKWYSFAVAFDHEDRPGEAEANAKLIAASPDLLEACKKALAEFDCVNSVEPGFVDSRTGIIAKAMKAAIAKAEGN